MSAHRSSGRFTLQLGALTLVAAAFITLGPSPAGAYRFDVNGSNPINWNANSAQPGIWNNATKTLTWHFNPHNFPQPTWPSVAQTGAAFENSYKTIQDTTGTSLKIVRGADSVGTPKSGDGRLDMFMTYGGKSAITGADISGYFALTHVVTNGTSLIDADVEMNGGPANFPRWDTTGPPAPAATSHDIETTSCHEQLHSIGAGHPVYFYAMVWPTGRVPELLQYDRCISPDDRMVIRTLYPTTPPAFATINGTVKFSSAGNPPVNLAVVVATDGAGVPQATTVTDATGAYTINVPPGTYTVTAHHYLNTTYDPSDIDFTGAFPPDLAASGFIDVPPVAPTGALLATNVANVALLATPGTPTLTLAGLGLNGTGINSQVLFLPKGSIGSIQLQVTGATFLAVSNVSLGPGITITGAGATVAGGVVNIPFSVAANAATGLRDITFVTSTATTTNERLFLPAYIEVLDTGTLTVAASAGNPAAGTPAPGALDHPLLGVKLTASAVEDIRIRQIQFNIAGTGPTLPAVRLYIDNGTIGTVDPPPTDIRVFTGNAYAVNPVAETTPVTPPGTILFDNIALTVPAGQTVNLLLTADIPGVGSGDYTASFDPTNVSNIEAHGMFWGDVCVPAGAPPNGTITGGTINGGIQTVGSLVVSNLLQYRSSPPPTTPILVGGSTNLTQIALVGTPTSSVGTVGMDVEVSAVGTAFTNTPTSSSATITNASGTQLSIVVVGLTSGVSYHWQARPTSSTLAPGPWVSFGGNPDPNGVDFSVDASTTGAPTALAQFESDGVTPVPALPPGPAARGSVILSATRGTNNGPFPVRLEFEVQPALTGFSNMPTLTTAYGASGTTATVTFAGPTGDYHWQVRTASQFGSVSAWTPFAGAVNPFHLDAVVAITASAGCFGRAATGGGDGWILWGAAGLTLLILSFWGRSARKIAGALVLVFFFGAAAEAFEESPLPRSLAEWSSVSPIREAEEPSALALPEPASAVAAGSSWISLDAYLGMIFMSMSFNATRTDFINRVVKGVGTGVFGLEGLITVHPDWRVGLAVEGDFWADIRILAAGPVAMWRFAYSRANSNSGRPELEHFAKLGVFYEKLTVTKANFGSFDGNVGGRAGYELRFAIGRNWSITADAEVVYAKWKFAPAILSGNTSIGGIGGIVTVGIAFMP